MARDKIKILYLDDEENNLTSFKAAFRRDYQIFTTTTAQEAVQILSENEVHIVISDQKMPNISGVEFFELIIPDFPDPVRMLLTGYADIEAVIDAVNKGQIFRYIAKPWNEQDLKITIENAFEVFDTRRQLKQKQVALEKAYNELEKFVYSASHDLRAPLVSILGVIKLAREEQLDSTAMSYFQMIEKSVNKLDSFVQNIINYYQNLKKGEIISEINIELLVDEVFENYRHFEGAEEVEFNKAIDANQVLFSDELRVKMILNNLISNAIKYRDTKKEMPKFDLAVRVEDDKAVISITDNGIGIPRENLSKVFDMFYRTAEVGVGNGIGLYIVKEAVDKLGGSIEASSEPFKYTTFTLEIPNRRG
ncbi:MAG: hybrid sensor histidine kinase/response regulator [Flavobacteriales bacterium]|nr:hybrid sensor histidine kinase/response regulator [Flavobacteriales bacterium]